MLTSGSLGEEEIFEINDLYVDLNQAEVES
jgi:hypothetical protein